MSNEDYKFTALNKAVSTDDELQKIKKELSVNGTSSTLRDALMTACREGYFLELIADMYALVGDDELNFKKQLLALHNNGLINVVDEFLRLTKSGEQDFFFIRHVFEMILPDIDAPTHIVMTCVKHLTVQAGNDLAAGMLLVPFKRFCEASLKRSEEALDIAIHNVTELEPLNFISPALEAWSSQNLPLSVAKAVELTTHDNIKICTQAVYALGNINYNNDLLLVEDAVEALDGTIKRQYDTRLSEGILKSSFSLYLADNNKVQEVYCLIKLALVERNENEIHAASELFFREHERLPKCILELLLNSLRHTNPNNKGTLNNIDYGLQSLLKKGYLGEALLLLERLLITNKADLSIDVFNSFSRDVLVNNEALNILITKWFLARDIALGRAVYDLVQQCRGSDIGLSVAPGQLDSKAGESLFLARKAVGWMFTKPVSATSFVVSLIGFCRDDELKEFEELLFNPLLICYSGSVKQYLVNELPKLREASQQVVTNVLTRLDEYHKGLESAANIPELRPSQLQRATHHRYFSELMADARKEAEKNSIFGQLVTKSILLYGNKSVHYMSDGKGTSSRQEIPLQQIEHAIEFPSLENLDPHSLDYMMRAFRVEGCH